MRLVPTKAKYSSIALSVSSSMAVGNPHIIQANTMMLMPRKLRQLSKNAIPLPTKSILNTKEWSSCILDLQLLLTLLQLMWLPQPLIWSPNTKTSQLVLLTFISSMTYGNAPNKVAAVT